MRVVFFFSLNFVFRKWFFNVMKVACDTTMPAQIFIGIWYTYKIQNVNWNENHFNIGNRASMISFIQWQTHPMGGALFFTIIQIPKCVFIIIIVRKNIMIIALFTLSFLCSLSLRSWFFSVFFFLGAACNLCFSNVILHIKCADSNCILFFTHAAHTFRNWISFGGYCSCEIRNNFYNFFDSIFFLLVLWKQTVLFFVDSLCLSFFFLVNQNENKTGLLVEHRWVFDGALHISIKKLTAFLRMLELILQK